MRPVSASRVTRAPVHYPASDGKPMAETQVHVDLIVSTLALLRHVFSRRRKVYIAGNIYLYYEEGRPRKRRAPDIMVVKGVDGTRQRLLFKTWVEEVVPRCIMEFTSKETAHEDLGPKYEVYQALGVNEYLLFDPLAEYLPRQLMGFRLAGAAYQPIPEDPKGRILSRELGLRLVADGTALHFFDRRAGQKVLTPDEAYLKLQEYSRRIEELESGAPR
jgi:Uma2 family endonuclease